MMMVNNPVWTSGICDCFSDMSTCCLSCWCPCVQYGKNVEALTKQACAGPCVTFFCLQIMCFGSSWIVSHQTRVDLRAKFGIEGNCCADCCCHLWCRCCAIAQEAREIQKRGFLAVPNQVVAVQQTQVQGGMMMQPMPMQGPPMQMQGQPMQMQGQPMHMQGQPMQMQGMTQQGGMMQPGMPMQQPGPR